VDLKARKFPGYDDATAIDTTEERELIWLNLRRGINEDVKERGREEAKGNTQLMPANLTISFYFTELTLRFWLGMTVVGSPAARPAVGMSPPRSPVRRPAAPHLCPTTTIRSRRRLLRPTRPDRARLPPTDIAQRSARPTLPASSDFSAPDRRRRWNVSLPPRVRTASIVVSRAALSAGLNVRSRPYFMRRKVRAVRKRE